MKKKQEIKFEIKLHSAFELAHEGNVKELTTILARCGFFVTIRTSENGWHLVEVYSNRNI